MARETGFLRRQSKLKPEKFIDTLMFTGQVQDQLSLQDCCNDLVQQHHTSLSKVGLHKRFNDTSLSFIKAVFAEQMASKLDIPELGKKWKAFSGVMIADSCKFSLPEVFKGQYPPLGGCRGGKSLMNIQYSFDLKYGNWQYLEFTSARENDQSYSRKTFDNIIENTLYLRDLGFVIHDYLLTVINRGAFFLNRLHPCCKPVLSNGKVIDWNGLYHRMMTNRESKYEAEVMIGAGKKALRCRLVAVPVPQEVWSERIRKGKKQATGHGYGQSQEYRDRSRFSIFITNVPQATLKAEDVIELYRLRWQIETIFKSWKSLYQIHRVKAVKIERLHCQLLARFILILINWKIYRHVNDLVQQALPDYACSMWKLVKLTLTAGNTIRKIISGKTSFKTWAKRTIYPIIHSLLIEPKRGRIPAFQIELKAFLS